MEPSTKNFSVSELRCSCHACLKQKPNRCDWPALKALQRLREEYGKPIALTSAYRCESHPVERKKKQPGTHYKGTAFDIAVPYGKDRFTLILLAIKHGFNGIGFSKNFLHIDHKRPVGTTWDYS